jgi:hypothetical protein
MQHVVILGVFHKKDSDRWLRRQSQIEPLVASRVAPYILFESVHDTRLAFQNTTQAYVGRFPNLMCSADRRVPTVIFPRILGNMKRLGPAEPGLNSKVLRSNSFFGWCV